MSRQSRRTRRTTPTHSSQDEMDDLGDPNADQLVGSGASTESVGGACMDEEEEEIIDDDEFNSDGGTPTNTSSVLINNNNSNGGGEEDASAAHELLMSVDDDSELEAIKARVREMEEETEKLKQLQSEVDRQMQPGLHHAPLDRTPYSGGGGGGSGQPGFLGTPPGRAGNASASSLNSTPSSGGGGVGAEAKPELTLEEKMEADARSVYVGNVDYGATAEELEQHFHGCGSVNRVTILCNKFDGHPKGFAYIEFADRESVATAMAMDESLFRARQIKVMPKRTNRPGLCRTDRPPAGFRGGGGRARGRGRFARGRFNPRRGGYRGGSISGRGLHYYAPY